MGELMTNKETALQLIEQLIERAEKDDLNYKHWCVKNHKSSKAIGESFMVFHLKALKVLIEDNDE